MDLPADLDDIKELAQHGNTRFLLELEFVELLANPWYLQSKLFVSGLFVVAEFLSVSWYPGASPFIFFSSFSSFCLFCILKCFHLCFC